VTLQERLKLVVKSRAFRLAVLFSNKLDGLYFEWSTIVDAPVSAAMTLDEFKEYYGLRHGQDGLLDLPQRLERVEATGTSEHGCDSAEESIWLNRAGLNETWLNREQLIAYLKENAADTSAEWLPPPLGLSRDYSVDEDPRTSFEAFMGRGPANEPPLRSGKGETR
jgi:hypothetical protein